jgi:y4mF family transcriptional regulator
MLYFPSLIVDDIKRRTVLYPKGTIVEFAKEIMAMRKAAGLTQAQLAKRAGVGLRFIRELEQGKPTVRLDKINQVLELLGYELCIRRKP